MAEDLVLRVETGAVNVNVTDEHGETIGTFRFNPADSNILKRYGKVVDFFNAVSFDEKASEEEQLKQVEALADDIAEQFDYLLGYDVSGGLFDQCGPLTVTKNGDFFFEQVLDGLGGLIEQVTKKRLDKKLAKIRKLTEAAPGGKARG